MITPTKIAVQNIRSVTDAVIEPDPDGITSLTGPIGAGKSSVLTALVWVLYGEVGGVPGLLVQSEMRRRGATEPVVATVEFGLYGQQFVATRSLRRSKSGKETAHADLWIDGMKQPSITPSKLTAKIVALTGLTGRAFTGAFFIAQGNLPALAEGTPTAVAALVEEQTGLAPLTRQVDTARAEARDAQIRADALPGSLEAVEAAQRDVDAAQRDGQEVWDKVDAAQADRDQSIARLTHADTEHDTLTRSRSRAQQAREQVAALGATMQSLTEQHQEVADALAAVTAVGDLVTITTRGRAVQDATGQVRNAIAAGQHATQGLDRARVASERATQEVGQNPDPDGARASELHERTRLAGESWATARAEWERLNKALTQLQDADTSGHQCPTCTQSLPDPGALIGALGSQQQQVTDRGQRAAAALTQFTEQQTALSDAIRAWDAATTAAERATGQVSTAEQEVRAATTAAASATAALVDLIGGPAHATPTGAVEHATTVLAQLADAAAEARRVDGLHTQAASLTQRANEVRDKLTAATETAGTGPSDAEMSAAATTLGQARSTAEQARSTWQQVKSESDILTERARATEQARDAQQRLLDHKADAATHADTLRHAHQMLVALRRDLVSEYCAVISTAATDLMETVGGGDHVGVAIGDDFIPQVILNDGTTRPMRVLSGGEKMRAALCLRLGIAEQISGTGGEGMIYADEITANHDAETTRQVVTMMRSLGRPLVVIAHADEVQQIATKVYQVSKADEMTGTMIQTASNLAARQLAAAGV